MRSKNIFFVGLLLLLAACSGHSVTYTGREESTVGVPGFDKNGKRLSPNVKLGQGYSVDGETYIPRYQPDYEEVGLASWYGPGFHGGRTANGEVFDKTEMTAAHRTLPLPSIVRVTMLSTGKSAIVRVNDRGPFAKGRIIDLSRNAAEKIGLIGVGVGKVRVQYLPAESQRFADLLADGRDPKSIDVASEVVAYTAQQPTQLASQQQPAESPFNLVKDEGYDSSDEPTVLERLNPIPSAHAATPPLIAPQEPAESDAPVAYEEDDPNAEAPPAVGDNPDIVRSQDLPPSSLPAPAGKPIPQPTGPVIVPKSSPVAASPPPAAIVHEPQAPPVVVPISGRYIQLGAFSNKTNAQSLVGKVGDIGAASVTEGLSSGGQPIYRVRMGPYADEQALQDALGKLGVRGVAAQPVHQP